MMPATSKSARCGGLPRPIIKSHYKKSGCGPGLGELPEILGFPCNIFATAEASDFKLGIQIGSAKAHHKITHIERSGHGLGLGELPKILWFPFNIYTMPEANDFKFDIQLRFSKAHHKTTPSGKVGLALG